MKHRLDRIGRLRCIRARHRELIAHYRAIGAVLLEQEQVVYAHLVNQEIWLMGQQAPRLP